MGGRAGTAALALAVAMAGWAAPTAEAGERARARADARVERALERVVAMRQGPPGVAALVHRRGEETLIRAGVADLASGRPLRANAHMRLASTSKAFSGAVALALVDQGVLSLETTVGERLPAMPPAWHAVTLRQLLGHTGGVPSFTKAEAFLDYFAANLRAEPTPEELLAFVAGEPLEFTPGTSFRYSNSDNLLIGLIAEEATGRSYEELLAELVFAPLELRRTALPRGWRLPAPLIRGYDLKPREDLTECCSMAVLWAAGGLYSTPRELARFTRAYVGGELFGEAQRAAQRSFRPGLSEPPGPGTTDAGLAVFRYRTRCGTVFGHTGNVFGYTQFTAASRNGRRSVTVAANEQLSPEVPGERGRAAFAKLRRAWRQATCAALTG